jgi:hypothetical protein
LASHPVLSASLKHRTTHHSASFLSPVSFIVPTYSVEPHLGQQA